jgi:hypothetical protein
MWIKRSGLPIFFYFIGILFAHHPMLFSGLRRVQIDHEDPRFINYLLEHTYQWLRGYPLHGELWSPPFFYPAQEVLAFSDTLFSAGPLYWPWRLAGLPADTSFQLWLMTCVSVNYLAFFLLLSRALRLRVVPSTMGAFLFAFGAPRIVEIGHPQLLTQFFSVIAIFAFLQIFDDRALPRWRRTLQWGVALLAITAQLYSAFYLGWFLIFALGVAFVWASYSRRLRWKLLAAVRRDYLAIAISSILCAFLIWPLVSHYREMARVLGFRTMNEVFLAVPMFRSWIYMGPDSWLYGWMPKVRWFLVFGERETAHRIGVGWITPLVCLTGLFLGRDDPVIRILGLTGLTLFFIATPIPRELILGLALMEWSLCAAIFVRSRGKARMQLFAFALFALLSWVLFPSSALVLVCVVAGPALALGETILRRLRRLLYSTTAVACGLFLLLSTFMDEPAVLITAALGIPGMIALNRGAMPTLAPPELAALVLATATALVFLPGSLVLWEYVYSFVPGGAVIRVSARVALLMLIPLSVGFAKFWDWFVNHAGWRYATPLGVFCMLEQGIWTTSFDKQGARERIQTVASWVECDGKPRAFFYSSHRPGFPNWNDHVDAMWAGLATDVPTVNGYSSSVPPEWRPLYESAIREEWEENRVRESLRRWTRTTGIPPEEIAWVHNGRRLPINKVSGSDSSASPSTYWYGSPQSAEDRPSRTLLAIELTSPDAAGRTAIREPKSLP